jgi:hypothetical protein
VVFLFSDNEIGTNAETIEAFFDLSDSRKPKAPVQDLSGRRMTGYKGTKPTGSS